MWHGAVPGIQFLPCWEFGGNKTHTREIREQVKRIEWRVARHVLSLFRGPRKEVRKLVQVGSLVGVGKMGRLTSVCPNSLPVGDPLAFPREFFPLIHPSHSVSVAFVPVL